MRGKDDCEWLSVKETTEKKEGMETYSQGACCLQRFVKPRRRNMRLIHINTRHYNLLGEEQMGNVMATNAHGDWEWKTFDWLGERERGQSETEQSGKQSVGQSKQWKNYSVKRRKISYTEKNLKSLTILFPQRRPKWWGARSANINLIQFLSECIRFHELINADCCSCETNDESFSNVSTETEYIYILLKKRESILVFYKVYLFC